MIHRLIIGKFNISILVILNKMTLESFFLFLMQGYSCDHDRDHFFLSASCHFFSAWSPVLWDGFPASFH